MKKIFIPSLKIKNKTEQVTVSDLNEIVRTLDAVLKSIEMIVKQLDQIDTFFYK